MEELIKEQKNALVSLCDRLNKRKVAAKLEDSGDITLLTVYLPGTPEGTELFTDICFFPQEERMGQVSFCNMRTEIKDLSGLELEKVNDYCRRVSELNVTLPIGAYGIELSEDESRLQRLLFTVTIPIVPEIKGEKLTDTLEDTLGLSAETIIQTMAGL